MNDAEVIATIVAGDLDGLAAALNRYAAPLYEYCYPLAPDEAAEAVEDTFIIAWSKVDELRNPDKLFAWLQAVAGNECVRRRLAKGLTGLPDYVPAGAYLPPELAGRVLSACADNTPPGRARRVSVTHRAGPFGFDGFPKTNLPGGLRRRIRRHPLTAASVVGVAAAVTAAAAIGAIGFPIGSPHHVQAAGVSPHGRAVQVSTGSSAALPTTPATQIPANPSTPKPSYQPRHAASPPPSYQPRHAASPPPGGQSGSVATTASSTMSAPPPPAPAVPAPPTVKAGQGHKGKGVGLGLLKQHKNPGGADDQGNNSGGNS